MMTAELSNVALGLGCLLLGCGTSTPAGSGTSQAGASTGISTSTGSSTGIGPGASATTSSTSLSGAGSTSTGPSDAGSTSTSTGASADETGLPPPGFLTHQDVSPNLVCDLWSENCPPGEKCMPIANDGGSAWNATQCRPVVGDPDSIGESCTLTMGTAVDGYDTCEKHSMCWDVDSETGEGSCVGMCLGSEGAPTCFEVDSMCTITGGAVWALCFPSCDALLQNCGEGEACYPLNGNFVCAPAAAEEGEGNLADACEFANACQPGLYCGPADGFCSAGAAECCLPLCAVSEPDCPDPLVCVPAFESGTGPAVFEDVGLCGVG